jgi:hypothetical protein
MVRLLMIGIVVAALAAALPAADSDRVSIEMPISGPVFFRLGDETVTSYHTGPGLAQPYLWPLYAPGGVAVTRAWPIKVKAPAITMDHPHHVSAWFCHGEILADADANAKSRAIDFWSTLPGHGVIGCVRTELPDRNRLVTHNEWRTSDGQTVLNEVRAMSLSPIAGGRLVVMTIDLTPATGSVTFGDTKEGAFAIRVDDQLRVGDKKGKNPKSRITNADGKEGEKGCWGYQSSWCDYSGEIDGQPVGISLFDDSTNKPRACWHVRDYGLMAANPFGREKSGFPGVRGRRDLVKLDKGDHLKLRYGIFLHGGDAATGKVALAFEHFSKKSD